MKCTLLTLLTTLSLTHATIHLHETFSDDTYKTKWTVPTKWKETSELGQWVRTSGQWYADVNDTGLQTSQDAKFYGLSRPLDGPILTQDGKDTELILQYSVKHEQNIDCGGAYIKLLPVETFDAKTFGGDTPYGIMFGPDICGSTKKTHVILHSTGKHSNVEITQEIPLIKDALSHLYTLILRRDNTFEVLTDHKSVRKGTLEDAFELLEPQRITDPNISKPTDWVDAKRIVDPNDSKPDNYDDTLEMIADPEAHQPNDWDTEEDGQWEAPLIDNPEYNGPWNPQMIDNPEYKGKWEHPMIDNPEYQSNELLHLVCGKDGCGVVGFELWQVKSGTIFDDLVVTNDRVEADRLAEEFLKKKNLEKDMYDVIQKQKQDEEEEMYKDEGDDDDMDMNMDRDEFAQEL